MRNKKYKINSNPNVEAYKTTNPVYEKLLEVKEALTYDKLGKCEKDGLFDSQIFANCSFGKVTLPKELFGKLSIFTKNDKEIMVEVLPIFAPKFRFIKNKDVITEVYRKVILRRNRLNKLFELNAHNIIITNEIEFLKQAIVEARNVTADILKYLSNIREIEEIYKKFTF